MANKFKKSARNLSARDFVNVFLAFVRLESFSGILLFLCAVLAMIVANSALSEFYFDLWHQEFGFSFGGRFYGFSLHQWINDVLMSFFFLMVGLEIKREILFGYLSGFKKAAFPIIAAIGGMIVPGLIYLSFNASTASWHGFGIPMATDIAFALGVMLMLGSRAPLALKVFLVTLAVADDLGAILVIATAYPSPEGLHFAWLFGALLLSVVLILLNRIGISHLSVYLGLGVVLWFCVHNGGIHATVAAVILAFCVPVKPKLSSTDFINLLNEIPKNFEKMDNERENTLLTSSQISTIMKLNKDSLNVQNPLLRLENALQPLCAFLIMPLFAFVNAGVDIRADIHLDIDYIAAGVFLGLVVGKPIGILLTTFLCEKIGIASRPSGITWLHIFSAGLLAGIGFTMSIFISNIAFDTIEAANVAKLSILCASCVAGILGTISLILQKK